MMGDGEVLPGGVANAGRVTRIGGLVRRPAPPNAVVIHTLLEHLVAHGFDASRPQSLGDDGFELLSYLPGDVPIAPFPTWVNSEDTLRSVAGLVRRYHDAAASFVPPPGAAWNDDLADPAGGVLICHNDICLENVVFRGGLAAALLDFDFAAPGRPLWDVVQACRYWVPLTDPQLITASRGRLDPIARVAMFVDAYGLDAEDRIAFLDVLDEAETRSARFVAAQAAQGHSAFSWDDESQARYARKRAWIDRHREKLAMAITGHC
ncbi:phosphotransferase [Brevibacterium picturae]|uniref:Aminoglycoside phosphotransferase domain-containing protein n=1 Tax=Brevibacterium picturae TaxID=260553 RepID=A0ABP4LS24_9MICO